MYKECSQNPVHSTGIPGFQSYSADSSWNQWRSEKYWKIHVIASFKLAAVMVADNSWDLYVYIWVLEICHEGICK